jgi:hypothetical protein
MANLWRYKIVSGWNAGVSRLYALQLAFPHDTFVRLVHAFYAVFKFTAALGQFLCDFIRTAWDIATDCGGELYELTDVKFAGQHGTLQHKSSIECTTEKRGLGVGFAKM